MTRARILAIVAYALAYTGAVVAATEAHADGHTAYAVALFATAAGLLLAIRREHRHAADLIRTAAAYRHHQPVDPDHDAAVEYATAVPPGCRCETWWTSLGDHHHPRCPAHIHIWRDQS
ncbi:hypothetical protein [Streptomyces sp. 2P-4]|uniref:hypothetical protein n=1 Tax=Streptomyces sp. 2P-4 TaxID=2931974 RepID=UPI0025420747|nr:hypothetical protein [Streptomyces sp. 2P-4]